MKPLDNHHINLNDEDEIDIKEIFSIVLNYKKSILTMVILGTFLAFLKAYFSPNIYQSTALVKVTSEGYTSYKGDLVTRAMAGTQSNIDDEIVIFKTHHITDKALKNLNIGIRYYITKSFKRYELYKDSPFVVSIESMDAEAHRMYFKLTPLDKKTFRLTIEQPPLKTRVVNKIRSLLSRSDLKEKKISYSEIHPFGQIIETPWFTINIQKIHQFYEKDYFFTLNKNAFMGEFVQNGLSASLHTEYGNFIELKFTDTVPIRAKEILEAITHTYIEQNLKLKSESIEKKLYFIDIQLNAINETLKGSAEKLQSYKATNIIVDLDTKARIESTKLSTLESELYQINVQKDVLENILNYIHTHKDIKGIDPDSALQASPVVGNIIAKIQKDRVRYSTLLSNYTEVHPNVIEVTKRLNFMKKSLKETIINNLATLTKQKLSLKKSIDKHKNLLKTLPAQEQKLEQLTRNFMVNEGIYSFLLQKRAEIAIAESSVVANAHIFEEAEVDLLPIAPKRALIILVGVILSLILGISVAFLRDFLDNTVKTIEDIEKLTDIPIYGGIPLLRSKKDQHHYDEAMRMLWTNLEFSYTMKKESKLITFTSSVSGEGKTLTVSELGNMLAKSNKSVIILDLDMRKSSQHQKYNLSNNLGMSTLLTYKHTLKEVIRDTEYENLKIITGGPTPPNPTELIMSDILESVITELRGEYDYILIDSPPIGLVADAMKIMHMSDITLILFRSNVSKKDFIRNITRLTKDPKIHTGIILNGIKVGKDYGYGYGYGYGY